ncbi:MAG: biotin/lipoate A/B protein ligase family protein [Haloferacaceae archaeon]
MSDVAEMDWRLIREQGRPGAMQMALDEVAAETAADGGPCTVRVYRWSPGALSLGYNQGAETVDWDYCETQGVDVTRRQTGGGGIYHDVVGDISYSITAPTEALPGDLMDCYRLLLEPILRAFEWLDVPVEFAEEERPELYQPACYLRELHPAHDVVVPGEHAGGQARKISGTAQYRRRGAVVQHGSITFSARPERHLAVFDDPGVSVEAFRERVTAVDEHTAATRKTAVRAVERSLAGWADAYDGSWSEAELDRARERVAEKYGNDAWIRGRDGER